MTDTIAVNPETIATWLRPDGPVALTCREILLPVEGEGAVIFPPTYAKDGKGSPYDIDTLSDGTRIVSLDSVGSQANRIEPVFKARDDDSGYAIAELVPQIDIDYGNERKVSIMDAGHRLGDALIRSTELAEKAKTAFETFQRSGDAGPIAKLAPTSLLFGVWDSRGTQAKLPRILQSTIRAFDVSELKRSAQYNPALDYAALEVFSDDEKKKSDGNAKSPLAQQGFVHVPAADGHGGIIARGEILRLTTINLIALRRLKGEVPERTEALQRYILGLALVAAAEPLDGFLRAGCLLVNDFENPPAWMQVERDGKRMPVTLDTGSALKVAQASAEAFKVGGGQKVEFKKDMAKAIVSEAKSKTKKKAGEKADDEQTAD